MRTDWKSVAGMWRHMTIYAVSILGALVLLLLSVIVGGKEQTETPTEAPSKPQESTSAEVSVITLPEEKEATDPLKDEKEVLAKMLWGEARGCDLENQKQTVWCALNRYDDGRFGDTIIEVVSAPYQFQGYRESNPVTEEMMAVVDVVVSQWLDGDPGPGYLYFEGDGVQNHFREER